MTKFFLWILAGSLLAGCAGMTPVAEPQGRVVSAAFAPDGRLWRVTASKNHVYVDHSDDDGRRFSAPVEVNPDPQPIRATPEDRPGIAIDADGRILVVYGAADRWPWTVYYSVSGDGRRFSPPRPLVPEAPGKTYQVKAGAAGGVFHLYWHQGEARGEGTPLHRAVLEEPDRPSPGGAVAGHQCECCRIALAFDTEGRPVLLTRFVFPGTVRDHGLIFPASGTTRRVSFDDWRIEACPEHGPALASDREGRLHLVWFTLGQSRRGLFYARTDDRGRTLSPPMPVGDPKALAGHPDVLARGRRVVLVWQEFDGQQTRIRMVQSHDRGATWSTPRTLAESAAAADYPFLLARGDTVYLSWNTEAGYRLIPVPE